MSSGIAPLDELLAVALAGARRASAHVRDGWHHRDTVAVADKGAGDLVTSTDHAAEAAAIEAIRAACPGHAILAEESGADGTRSEFLWVIDPLDGSVNFAHGLPHFAVSVACLHRGTPLVGVIIDPLRDETFTAMRGAGAWRGTTRLRASACSRVDQALLGTVFPKPDAAAMPAYLRALPTLLATAHGVRRSGSMVLDLAYLASGRLDGFWQVGMKAWDLAAGTLLVEEAGGRVNLIGRRPAATVLDAHACIAAAPQLLDELVRLLGTFDTDPT